MFFLSWSYVKQLPACITENIWILDLTFISICKWILLLFAATFLFILRWYFCGHVYRFMHIFGGVCIYLSLHLICWIFIQLQILFLNSCWCFPVERQEGFCWCTWCCHCNLGAFWIAWIPFAYISVPCADSCSGYPLSLVKCIHLH